MVLESNNKTKALHKIMKPYYFKSSVKRNLHKIRTSAKFIEMFKQTFGEMFKNKLIESNNDSDSQNIYKSRRLLQKVEYQDNHMKLYALCPLCDPFEHPKNGFYPEAKLEKPTFYPLKASHGNNNNETYESHMLHHHGILRDGTQIAEPFVGFNSRVSQTSRSRHGLGNVEPARARNTVKKYLYSLQCVCPYAKNGTKDACNALFKITDPHNLHINPYQRYFNHVASCHHSDKCSESLQKPMNPNQQYHPNKEIELCVNGYGFLSISSPNYDKASSFAKTQREISEQVRKEVQSKEFDFDYMTSDIEVGQKLKDGLYEFYLKYGALTPGEYLTRMSWGL